MEPQLIYNPEFDIWEMIIKIIKQVYFYISPTVTSNLTFF